MDNQEYIKVSREIRNYKIARMNVLIFIAFTILNFVMVIAAERYMLFSIYTCLSLVIAGIAYDILAGMLVCAIVVLAVYGAMWFLCKKHDWAMIVLLVLFALDCVLLLIDVIRALMNKNFSLIVDVAIHGLMMYYLILGVKSSRALKKHFPQGVKLTMEELDEAYRLENGIDPKTGAPVYASQNGAATPQNGAMPYAPQAGTLPVGEATAAAGGEQTMNAEAGTENGFAAAAPIAPPAPARPDSPVLGEDTAKNKPVVQAAYNNSQICVKLTFTGKASLIVDGKIYAQGKTGGGFSAAARISAVVNGVEYTYEYQYKYPHIDHLLYADGIMIAHRTNY